MPIPFVPLINGVSYSWAIISINILGTIIYGTTAVSYQDAVQKENNYGAGGYPVSRGSGNYEAKASLTLYAEEVQKLVDVAPNNKLELIPPFDIEVSFEPTAGVIVTHTIKNCEFMGNSIEAKQGDKKIETKFDLVVSDIIWKS
jgi:hypothetical protein